MKRSNATRSGVTLMEILVAIFILGVGMIAILSLFPIGAVTMARAIQQDRTAAHAANADAMFRLYWKNLWLDPNGGGVYSSTNEAYAASLTRFPLNTPPGEELLPLLDRRRGVGPFPVPIPVTDISPASGQYGFTVLVDPIGWRTQATAGEQQNVGGIPLTMPVRTTLGLAAADPTPRMAVRLTTFLDELQYDRAGEPTALTGQLDRGGRFNVAWLVQRPKNNVPHEVNLTVLVFSGRSPTDTPSREFLVPMPVGGPGSTTPGDKYLTINYGGAGLSRPPLRRGGWVAHSYLVIPVGGTTPVNTLSFYRVSGINDDTNGVLICDLETPLKPATGTLVPGSEFAVVFENLFDVFDRGVVSPLAATGR